MLIRKRTTSRLVWFMLAIYFALSAGIANAAGFGIRGVLGRAHAAGVDPLARALSMPDDPEPTYEALRPFL